VTRALVIGGGIAGCAAAIALHRIGVQAEVSEAGSDDHAETGAFLQIAPNGMRALAVDPGGFAPGGMVSRNARGRRVGQMDVGDDPRRYGARVVVLERWRLLEALRDRVRALGIPLTVGARLQRLEAGADGVTAGFADGGTARGDLLLGCDAPAPAPARCSCPRPRRPSTPA